MKRFLQELSPAQLQRLRDRVESAVGNDWRIISDATFIRLYAEYCRMYRIGVIDLQSSYLFLKENITNV